ncbi:unnamed protein product [Candida verbasci]|uniref:AMMECR1 domain-containing protein n=1 Tax=Candida verbasci TaxID=1227364 RepID=A0A9W4TSL3_9ASCO|nr:unnamed protein product [Candida verbasci]
MSKTLSCYAFETLINKLQTDSKKIPLSSYFEILGEDSSKLPASAPLFITWNKNQSLRGCIGTFQSLPISSGVSKFAINSAFQDPRFPPIKAKELDSLSVSVTLLDNFREIKNANDWTIGLNGLKISFELDGDYYSGTFLPSVAEDEEWDKITTLYYLLKKADYSIAKSNVAEFYKNGLDEGWLKLVKYDGLKQGVTYEEFNKIRNEI